MRIRVWIVGGMLFAAATLFSSCAAPAPAAAPEAAAGEAAAAEEAATEAAATEAAATEAAAAPAGEPGTVQFFTWAENPYEVSALNQMVEQFKERSPSVVVELTIETPGGTP